MSDRLIFSTDALPERDRFPAFCEEVIRRYTALDIITRERSQFRGAVELQRAESVDVGSFATAAASFDRAPHLVRDGDDGLIIMLCRSGTAYQSQRGYDQALQSGQGVICDCGYSGGLNMTTDSRFWSVKVPRAKITSLVPQIDQFGGVMLNKDPVARRLLFGYLAGTHDVDLSDGRRASRLYDEHIIGLIALAIGAEGDAREFVEQHGVRQVRRAAVVREIETSFGDPNLDAEVVAIRLGITSRYVHLLLEPTGQTFSEHLLEQRLMSAAAILRDPGQWGRKIADIAFQVGFADLSHFNRNFRRKYGATPTDIRHAAFQDAR